MNLAALYGSVLDEHDLRHNILYDMDDHTIQMRGADCDNTVDEPTKERFITEDNVIDLVQFRESEIFPPVLLEMDRLQAHEAGSSIFSENSSIDASSDQNNPVPENYVRIKKRTYNPPEKLVRKRQCTPSKWMKNLSKMLVNTGQEHISLKTKKIVPAREMLASCGSRCRFKCDAKITEDERAIVFRDFWSIGNHNNQYDYVLRHVILIPNNKPTNVEGKKRQSTQYNLPVTGNKIKVCQKMFLNTLGISSKWVHTAITKSINGNAAIIDMRGRSTTPRKIDPKKIESVIEHINSFPRLESHYARKDTKKEYLKEGLSSISQIYEIYIEWARENDKKIATKRQYSDVFNNEFNIAFFRPKKDQCDFCQQFRNSNVIERRAIQDEYDQHMEDKKAARKLKDEDKVDAKNKDNMSLCCFDLEKVLQTPKASTSALYYERKLSVANFTIYDLSCHEAVCYFWTEHEAHRGSNEIASCLLNYMTKKFSEGVTDFRFYSDNCAGQNRNKFVFSMYIYALATLKINIRHRFLEKGHTQNEGDSVHAAIERKSENRNIYAPSEWIDVILSAKKTGKPYTVVNLTSDMIYDFKDLAQNQNWLKNLNNDNFMMSKVKEVVIEGTSIDLIKYKTSFKGTDFSLSTRKRNQLIHTKDYTSLVQG